MKKNFHYFLFFCFLVFGFLNFSDLDLGPISENMKMYNISKIPVFFFYVRIINHTTLPFLADFHKAKSFQKTLQIINSIKSPNEIPNCSAANCKYAISSFYFY